MPVSPALFQYFRECLLTDYRSLALLNLYSSRVEQRLFLPDREMLLTGEMPWYPLPHEYALKVMAKLQLFQREKQLYYCTLVLRGKTANGEDIYAPLQLMPVKPEQQEDGVVVAVVPEQKILNLQALQLATGIESERLQQLARLWPEQLDEAGVIRLARLLEKYCPLLDTGHLYQYPHLMSERQLKHQPKTPAADKPALQLMPVAFFALISMSEGVSVIETDLKALAEQQVYSPPLQALFGGKPQSAYAEPPVTVEILSDAQQQALRNAGRHSLSQITGPPGTGKSFTIANLAVSQLALNKSVLVVAKTDVAADVLYKLIEGLLPELKVCIRAGGAYRKNLQHYFRDLLSGVNKYKWKQGELNAGQCRMQYNAIDRELALYEEQLHQVLDQHISWGRTLKEAQDTGALLVRLKEFYLRFRYQHDQPVWELALKVEQLLEQKHATTKKLIQAEYLQGLVNMLQYRRTELSNFYAATRSRISGEQQEYWQKVDFGAALEALPIWVVTLKDLGEVLPLKRELFDLVLIDEATQCDIASCLPALQRAKRAVVVGDPQQLRHLSFLSGAEQQRLQQKWGLNKLPAAYLDYRNNSLLDVLIMSLHSQEQVVMLDEHYRSQPLIISFSNKHFYGDSLRIMTQLPDHSHTALEAQLVEGKHEKGINEAEALLLLDWLKQKIKAEQLLSAELCSSLGVLSPFREQTDYLAKLIGEAISTQDLEKHNIQVATPYSFQGEERDIMLLSLVLDKHSHATAWRHMSKPDVLNVAITRARHYQLIFHSVNSAEVPQELLRNYLQHAGVQQPADLSQEQQAERDAFMGAVIGLLEGQGVTCWPAYPISGMELDILVRNKKGKYFGLDLIGYPGQHEDFLSLHRYRILSRIGITVFPIPFTHWHYRQEETLKALFKFLKMRRKAVPRAV